jgi:hypothetical protein
LAEGLEGLRRGVLVAVGAGGALAVAQLAADLHESRSRTLARAVTPLELLGLSQLSDVGVLLFTASGRHPDAGVALTGAVRQHANPIIVVTHRDPETLSRDFHHPAVSVVRLPSVVEKEGFLATNSVLAMTTALVAASGFVLPETLPQLVRDGVRSVRENALILGGPGLAAVSTDLETRLSETGLSAAQVTDYRNFAHGRHTGLSRRFEETTIVALVTPSLRDIAEATLATLPSSADVVRLETSLEWPLSVLDLLVASMKTLAATASGTDFDPSRPRVPEFGRRLYHLSSRRLIPAPRNPGDRKIAALGAADDPHIRGVAEDALREWLTDVRQVKFGGIVLDYDGTVCTTEERFELPTVAVRERLLAVLEAGVCRWVRERPRTLSASRPSRLGAKGVLASRRARAVQRWAVVDT